MIGQAPEFAADVQQIDYVSGQHRDRGEVSWPVYFDPVVNRKLATLAAGAGFIDPMARMCRGGLCPYRQGDQFLFADYGHYSTYGSALAVRTYFPVGRAH